MEDMRLNTGGISIHTSLYISGTTKLNNTTTCTSSLNVSGRTTLQGFVGIGNDGPFNSYGIFDVGGDNNTVYYSFFNKLRIAGNDANTIWQTSAVQPSICITTQNASAYIYHSIGNGTIKTTTGPGGFGINTGWDVNPRCALEVSGIACIHNGSPYAVANNFMQSGSLTIGGINANYGIAQNWTTNTTGFMMECADYTEMCVHDAGQRVASFMYYDGPNNRFL